MIKTDEATDRNSCWNKACDDERVFVLLARDAAAPDTLRFWANRRVELGKNQPNDPQIVEALDCADRMEDEAKRINYRPHGGGMAGHDDRPRARFEVGDRLTVNHGYGASNITFTVTEIRENHGALGAHRYWGRDDHGAAHGAYEDQIVDEKSSMAGHDATKTSEEKSRLTEAIRKEAFVQGYLASEKRGMQMTRGRSSTDEEILALLPHIDNFYAEWCKTRSK